MSNHWKIALVVSCALAAALGCSNDDAAIRVLQQVTAGLVDEVKAQNVELVELEAELTTCQADVAQAKRMAAVIRTKDVAHDVPAPVGEPSIQSLEAYKAALDRTLARQQGEQEHLRDEHQRCREELAALARPVRRRAVAKKPAPAPARPAQPATPTPAKEPEPEARDSKGAAVEFDRSSGRFKLGGNWK